MRIQEGISNLVVASFPTEREAQVIIGALGDEPKPVRDLWIAREDRFPHLSAVPEEQAGRRNTPVDALFSMADMAAGGALIGLAAALLSLQFGWISSERIAFAVATWVFGGIVIGSLVGGLRVLIKNTHGVDSHEDAPETRFLLMATSKQDADRARKQLDSQLDATAYPG